MYVSAWNHKLELQQNLLDAQDHCHANYRYMLLHLNMQTIMKKRLLNKIINDLKSSNAYKNDFSITPFLNSTYFPLNSNGIKILV